MSFTLSCFVSAGIFAQELSLNTVEQAAALRDKALQSDLAWDILESLTTEIGPRMAGSPADAAAVSWGVAKLHSLNFDNVWTEPVTVPVWRRLHESANIVSPFAQALTRAVLGGSVSTPKGGMTGEIIHFNTFEDLVASPANSAKGKIVYISNKMERHPSGRGYGQAGPARFMGPAEAAKKGAIALVIRSVGTDSQRSPHTGMTNYEEGIKKIPAAALSNPDADQMDRILIRNKAITMALNIVTETDQDTLSYNVIGEITGSEHPEQIIAIGGHLDSWDQGTGAVDDGAGIAIAVATAKLIAEQQRPQRSIRVVMFAAEEIGVFGGRQYAVAHQDELQNHIIGAESDGGAGNVLALSSNVGRQSLHVIDNMLALMAPLNIVRSAKVSGGSADFGPMVKAGMPAVGLEQDRSEYFDIHHTPDDTLNKVHPEELAQNVAAWAIFVKLAADWDGRFDR